MRIISLVVTVLSLIAIPASGAFAQSNSAVDEYTETVPGGGGDNPVSGGGDPTGGTPLPSDVAGELQAAGDDGVAAAELAESAGGPADRKPSTSSDRPSDDQGGGFGSAISEIIEPDDDSGMGIALPIILGAALIAATIFGIARSRGSKTPA